MSCGIEVAVITRKSKAYAWRMEDMGIKRYYESNKKIARYELLLEELKIKDEEACYVGDCEDILRDGW
jgi:3-deoxy-D-manno-octulosonate 8-phosphate phosphatase KdsC-like HAD superfamily phosphatase